MAAETVMPERRKDYLERGQALLRDRMRLVAGAEYTEALMALGLDPDLMCWVYLADEDRVELAIVSTLVDRAGPKILYDLLFTAYDRSATPKNVDPFEVAFYSPRSALGIDLLNTIRIDDAGFVEWKVNEQSPHIWQAIYHVGFNETKMVLGVGIYRVRRTTRNADQDRARLQNFKQNIEALAA